MRLRKRPAPGAVRVKAFGVGLAVEFGSDDLRALAPLVLPPQHTACEPDSVIGRFGLAGSEQEGYAVEALGQATIEHATLDVALNALEAQIRMFIAINADALVFVHAGVVAVAGRTLLIPGQSFTGKTTLVSELVRAGATYFSDEYAVLDGGGLVHPYARSLSIRDERGSVTERTVHELRGAAATESAEVGAVLVTRYRPEAEWRPRAITAGQAALALMANTLPARDRPEATLRAVSRAVSGAVLLQSDRGDARAMVPALLAELA